MDFFIGLGPLVLPIVHNIATDPMLTVVVSFAKHQTSNFRCLSDFVCTGFHIIQLGSNSLLIFYSDIGKHSGIFKRSNDQNREVGAA